MNHKRNVPDNAVYLTLIVAGILSLINLGSAFAFNIIVSLTLLALLSTYCTIHDLHWLRTPQAPLGVKSCLLPASP
jgi:L-asparagine transporter-like permease